jgi:hypothetical protein
MIDVLVASLIVAVLVPVLLVAALWWVIGCLAGQVVDRLVDLALAVLDF